MGETAAKDLDQIMVPTQWLDEWKVPYLGNYIPYRCDDVDRVPTVVKQGYLGMEHFLFSLPY